jgi:uncharacterized protein (TIGR01777 family)
LHILITGGTGLIGTAVCRALHTRGHQLTILTRQARASETGVTFVTALKDCAGGVDAVINLAGAGLADKRWTASYKREIISSRIDLTRDLVEWMAAQPAPPGRLISASAIGYYGASEEAVFTEESAAGEGFSATLCQQWEQAASKASSAGVQVVMLRLGVVLAKEGGALGKMTQSFQVGVESWLGSGTQWLSWIHLDDAVRVIEHALGEASPALVYNATAPEPARHRELAHEVGCQSGSWIKLAVPAFAARLLAGQMAEELLLSGQRVLPQALLAEGFEFHYPTLAAALGHLQAR